MTLKSNYLVRLNIMYSCVTIFIAEVLDEEESRGASLEQGNSSAWLHILASYIVSNSH